MDDNLKTILQTMDSDELCKSLRAMTGEGKLRRSTARTKIIIKMHQQDMQGQADGVGYTTGITLKYALGQVKMKEKSTARNPKGAIPSMLKYRLYHERYCQKLGHTKFNHKDCFVSGKRER